MGKFESSEKFHKISKHATSEPLSAPIVAPISFKLSLFTVSMPNFMFRLPNRVQKQRISCIPSAKKRKAQAQGPSPSPMPSTSTESSSSVAAAPSALTTPTPPAVQGAPRDVVSVPLLLHRSSPLPVPVSRGLRTRRTIPFRPALCITHPSPPQVLTNSLVTTAVMGSLGLGIGALASPALIQLTVPDAAPTSSLLLASLTSPPSPQTLALGLVTAAAVTAARHALCSANREFRDSTRSSNALVLANLTPGPDYLVAGALPGVAEELLFRHALIPAIAPDYRGVLISAAVFGALHINPQRGPVFAAWATAVGAVYGFLFLYSESIYAPALAHAVANFLSAALWKSGALDRIQDEPDSSSESNSGSSKL